MVRRMLRTAGRTALISGTATAVSGRVAHSQQQKLAKAHAQSKTQPSPTRSSHGHHEAGNDLTESLMRLAELKASGALSDKEFKAAKAKLLS